MFRRSRYSLFDASPDYDQSSTPTLADYTDTDELNWESDSEADCLIPSFLPSTLIRCMKESLDNHEHGTDTSPSKTPPLESASAQFESAHDDILFADSTTLIDEIVADIEKDKATVERELHTRLYEMILKYPRLKSQIKQLANECGFTDTQKTLPSAPRPHQFSLRYQVLDREMPDEITQLIDDMSDFVREYGQKAKSGYRK